MNENTIASLKDEVNELRGQRAELRQALQMYVNVYGYASEVEKMDGEQVKVYTHAKVILNKTK